MKKYLSLRWILWLAATTLFAIAFFLFYFSSKTHLIPITLDAGAHATTKIFRPLPYHSMGMELWFQRHADHQRPELGKWSPNTQDGDDLIFEEPGETVQIEVTANGQTFRVTALPASGYGQNIITRNLVCMRENQNPQRFHLGACPDSPPESYPAGITTLDIKVLASGASLRGEKIQVAVQPPLGFKVSENSTAYHWLWLMYFYPVYLGILLLWLILLLVFPARRPLPATDA